MTVIIVAYSGLGGRRFAVVPSDRRGSPLACCLASQEDARVWAVTNSHQVVTS